MVFGANDNGGICRCVGDVSDDFCRRAVSITGSDDFAWRFGVDDDFCLGVELSGGLDVLELEVGVDVAVAIPYDDLGIGDLGVGEGGGIFED